MKTMQRLSIALAASALLLPVGGAHAAPAVTAIQPGANVVIGPNSCTLNFVFETTTKKYIGTAGHCGNVGQIAKSSSPTKDIGPIVYSENSGAPGIDFALIEIDPVRWSEIQPSVRSYGGPVGATNAAETSTGDIVLVTGYGVGFSLTSTTRDRSGVLISDNANEYVTDMVAVNGDSGGPVLHSKTGKALGTVSRYNLPLSTDIGPTVERILAKLRNNGYASLQLVTAPYSP